MILMEFLGSRTVRTYSARQSADPEHRAKHEFAEACFELAGLQPDFAFVGMSPEPTSQQKLEALDLIPPILANFADRLERQASELAAWNIKAAGRNEVIVREAARNWDLLRKLEESMSNAGPAH